MRGFQLHRISGATCVAISCKFNHICHRRYKWCASATYTMLEPHRLVDESSRENIQPSHVHLSLHVPKISARS